MTERIHYLTKEGLEKLQNELQELVHVRRKEISARIQEAKELGDLSENAEYQEAKNEQAFNEGRIEEIEQTLKHAEVISEQKSTADEVRVGSEVMTDFQGKNLLLQIVGSNEADPISGKISNESPIGQALLGRKTGDAVTVQTPKGDAVYTIVKIS